MYYAGNNSTIFNFSEVYYHLFCLTFNFRKFSSHQCTKFDKFNIAILFITSTAVCVHDIQQPIMYNSQLIFLYGYNVCLKMIFTSSEYKLEKKSLISNNCIKVKSTFFHTKIFPFPILENYINVMAFFHSCLLSAN